MIDESTLPIPSMYESCIPFFGYPYGHGFVYYVPSPKYGAEVGKRRVNWAFHETIANKNIPGITPDDKGFVSTIKRSELGREKQDQRASRFTKFQKIDCWHGIKYLRDCRRENSFHYP